MFGFGKRKCRECGSELAEMEALRDRSDDLMKSSALGSAEPIADICASCRLKLTKSTQSLAMNLHVMEARRVEAEAKLAETPAPPPSAKREIAQTVRAGSETPKPAYQPGGGYKTEEEKSALFDAPSFDEIKGFPDLLLWAIGTGAGRRVAAAAFLFLIMIINSISNDDDFVPTNVPDAAELPSVEEPLPEPAAPIPTAYARPANNPGSWATTGDYPMRALREQREGSAAFRLTVNPQGAVTDCLITQSSGHADLDAATCEAITKRARFERTPVGTPDRGYRNRVTWRIPRE
jgi:TonB family protein